MTLLGALKKMDFEKHMRVGTAFTIVLISSIMLACGGGSVKRSTVWSEVLSDAAGRQLGSFTFTMAQDNTALTGSNMTFANLGSLSPCFSQGTVIVGKMAEGMTNGGAMTMVILWTTPDDAQHNTLNMQGNMAMGMASGSGTFTLTGETAGCTSQPGTYTMTQTTM